MTPTCPRCNASYTRGGFLCRWCLDELQRLDRRRRLDGRDPVPFTKPGKIKGDPVKIASCLALFFFALFATPTLAEETCTLGEVITLDGGGTCTVTACATAAGLQDCALTDCENDGLPITCCTSDGLTVCSSGALSLMVEQSIYSPSTDPSWWADFQPPWWVILWREADAGLTFEYSDGTSWTTLTGTVEGGVFVDGYAAGGNSNASSGQGCGGSSGNACFLPETLAWANAYSNVTGPTGFTLTSTDGSVRLACERSDVVVAGRLVKMAVHDCTTAWFSGAVWSSPTDCTGPQGANLGECLGYAYTQSH